MKIEVHVENDNTAEIKSKVQSGITRALEAAGLFVSSVAIVNAPRDTGLLSGSIHHRMTGEKEVSIGTNVEYGKYQELGTYKMAAHPFLRPAIQDSASAVAQIIAQALK